MIPQQKKFHTFDLHAKKQPSTHGSEVGLEHTVDGRNPAPIDGLSPYIIYIFVGFQQVSTIQGAGFLPSVGVRFAFWQPRNLASRPEIRHENLRCSVVHIRKTGGYQRQGSELSQVGDILRVRFLFSSILQPSDDSHLMSLLLLLCIHFFFGGSLALLREVARRAMNAVGGAMEVLSGGASLT